jgi:hypothetical protein
MYMPSDQRFDADAFFAARDLMLRELFERATATLAPNVLPRRSRINSVGR